MSKEPVTTFRLIGFNPRRYSRGVEAARVEVLEDGVEQGWLWMSPEDLQANLDEFGDSEDLKAALVAYTRHKSGL